MSSTLRYRWGATRPDVQMWLFDDDGSLIDFSGYDSFTFSVYADASDPLLTKTSGITGAVGAGTEPTGTPNVVVNPADGDFEFTPGSYSWELIAVDGGEPRFFVGPFALGDSTLRPVP